MKGTRTSVTAYIDDESAPNNTALGSLSNVEPLTKIGVIAKTPALSIGIAAGKKSRRGGPTAARVVGHSTNRLRYLGVALELAGKDQGVILDG